MATITSFPLTTVPLSPLIGIKIDYSTTTTDADPGPGIFRLNNATIASATAAYIDNVDNGGRTISGLLDLMDNGTSAVRGKIRFENVDDQTIWAEFEVTGSVVDGTGYRKITLQNGVAAGVFVSGDTFAIAFYAKGDSSGREILTADRTYYVRSDGNDANTGLSDTAGGAWLTLQHAGDWIAGNVDLGDYDITVQVRNGTYAGLQMLRPFVGNGWVTFVGDPTTPTNVVIQAGAVPAGFNATFDAAYKISGFEVNDTSTTYALYASAHGKIRVVGNCKLGPIATSGGVIRTNVSGQIILESNWSSTGNTQCLFWNEFGGTTENSGSHTVTLTGTPAYSAATSYADGGYFNGPSITFSGSATGQRYLAQHGGYIFTGNAGANYFPGNSAGDSTTGYYN